MSARQLGKQIKLDIRLHWTIRVVDDDGGTTINHTKFQVSKSINSEAMFLLVGIKQTTRHAVECRIQLSIHTHSQNRERERERLQNK